jgi:starvation-inducible outer membrane lipoprotein
MKPVADAVTLVLGTLAAALLLAACHEIPQNAAKPFAGKAETHLDDPKALAARAQHQNEYVRMGDLPATASQEK